MVTVHGSGKAGPYAKRKASLVLRGYFIWV
jgi:hypothetical protein